jgi:hypothetical protein
MVNVSNEKRERKIEECKCLFSAGVLLGYKLTGLIVFLEIENLDDEKDNSVDCLRIVRFVLADTFQHEVRQIID